ncbi:MAG: hypothetical protein ACOCWQ_00015 [Nanoarchaeota archaeon]
MELLQCTKKFALPYYRQKDLMHGVEHIERLIRKAMEIAKKYEADEELLTLGAYLHGVIHLDEQGVRMFLHEQDLSPARIRQIIEVAKGSQKDGMPYSIEAMILHDAHLLEGGKTFLITKSLVTGTAKGQTLNQTITYIEQHILGKFHCYLPECQKTYREKEQFAEEFLMNLTKNL